MPFKLAPIHFVLIFWVALVQVADSMPVAYELSERVFEFGRVKIGEEYSHTFTITNVGTKDLVIESVKGCCSYVTCNANWGGPGPFKKSTTVLTNAEPPNIILEIAEEVVN